MLKSTEVLKKWVTTLSHRYWSIFIRLADVASQICEIPQNSLKIRLIQFKVIQGHRSWCQSKAHMQLSINSNSNFERISYSSRDIDTFSFKIPFPTPPCLTPPSGRPPCTINIIYTSPKSTFIGLQFCRKHHGSIFIHLAIVAFQNREMPNSDKFDLIAVQGHPKSSILVSIESSYATSF